jgi:hypothetical protein
MMELLTDVPTSDMIVLARRTYALAGGISDIRGRTQMSRSSRRTNLGNSSARKL